ncbi:tetratricopeptide repeat protein [Rugamonas sp. FT82W]|uniref:Tetratricopeptide repeat protein n=1 Tax=Duganella vulcania TaxID=2692166 RepID=A0A845G5A4_9BURK|nr:tetratricopeptide repeat protein [Duganella vulcania]MYM88652.1 tetratricopeptide repeat protein [Duganella vulcania]
MLKPWYAALLLGSSALMNAQAQQQPATAPSVVVAGQRHASPWFRAESQHLVVYSNTSNSQVADLLNQLEKLDYMLRLYTQPFLKSSGAEPRLTFYYHDGAVTLNPLGVRQPANAIGLYNSCNAGVQGYGVRLAPGDEEGLSALYEAYTRHFLYRYTDIRAPISFIDGMAHYFASVRFTDTEMVVGRTPVNLGRYLDFLGNGHRYSLEYKDVLEQNDSRGQNYASTAGIKLEFAARSWLLTHYMLSTDDNRKHLVDYLSAVYRDVPITEAFEQAYGLKVSELSTTLWRYRLQKQAVLTVHIPTLPAAVMNFDSLSESSGEFVLTEAALKSCPDSKTGESLLRKTAEAAVRYPSNAYVQRVLSRAQIDWGNPKDALPYLSAAASKPDAGAEVFYLLGEAQLRLNQPDAARDSLKRALTLDPKSAEAASALYQAGLKASATPDEATLQAAVTAWKNAHEVNTLARQAALAYAYAGEMPKARNALKLMAHNIREPELAAWAKTWLDKLAAGAGQAEVLAEMRTQPSSGTVFREWTIANSMVMQDVEYNAGLQDARSFLNQQSINPSSPDKAVQATFDTR